MRARLYPWLVNNDELDDCMVNMTKSMPLFKELVESCEIGFSLRKFSFGILSIIVTVLLII